MIVMPLRSGIVRLHNPLAFGQGLVEAFTHFIPLLIRWLGCIRGAAVFSFRSCSCPAAYGARLDNGCESFIDSM